MGVIRKYFGKACLFITQFCIALAILFPAMLLSWLLLPPLVGPIVVFILALGVGTMVGSFFDKYVQVGE